MNSFDKTNFILCDLKIFSLITRPTLHSFGLPVKAFKFTYYINLKDKSKTDFHSARMLFYLVGRTFRIKY